MEIDTLVGKNALKKDGRKDKPGLYEQMLPTNPNFKGNESIKPMTGPPNSSLVNNFLPKGWTCNASSPEKVAGRPNAEALIKEMLADKNTDNPDEDKNFDSDVFDEK
eukprot:8735449-Ditylum_brightwellii.AAC.1